MARKRPTKKKRKKGLARGRAARGRSLGGLGAKLAGDAASAAAKLVTRGRAGAAEVLHTKAADHLLQTLGHMKGLPMKIGQLLSYMDGVVPPEAEPIYRRALEQLQVRMDPVEWSELEPVVAEDLGRPASAVFSDVDPEPLAAASIGQVHAAHLSDGTPVVIKVQYPGIREAVTSDLQNVETILATMRRTLPGFDVGDAIENFGERLQAELDYEQEAQYQIRFRELWAHDPRIVIPEVFPELSGSRVLVTERHEGRTFQAVLGDKEAQRSHYGEILYWFVFRSLLGYGVFNADPHPGNYLFPDPERVVFLDFGSVQEYEKDDLARLIRLRKSLLAGERGPELWKRIRATFRMDDTSLDDPYWPIAEQFVLFTFEPILADQPFKYTRRYTDGLAALTLTAKRKMAARFVLRGVPVPRMRGWVFFNRILFGLNSILAALRARADWRSLLIEASAPSSG